MTDQQTRLSNADPHLLSIIAEHTNDCLLVTEAEPVEAELGGPRIIYINPAFERMTGFRADEAIGQTPRILQHPDIDQSELSKIRRAMENWEPVRVELLNRKKNGEPFWVELDIVPVADETGWYIYWVSLQREITERKKRELELEKARARAEKLNDRKDQFLATISHELRTPLNSIIGYSELLLKGDDDIGTEQKNYLRHVHDSGQQLLGVVRDLVDLTALQKDAVQLEPRWCEAETIIRQARRELDAIRSDRNVDIHIKIDKAIEIYCDPVRTKQALTHIMSNAVKFSDENSSVTVSLSEEAGNGIIRVTDSGAGMSSEDLELAFEPFWQAENVYSRKGSGLGLGLPLVRELMRLHGSELEVSSTTGEGTTVTLVFPNPTL